MSGRFVWLASYPKSGNTWMRAIVTALSSHPGLFAIADLGSGQQPFGLGGALGRYGLDVRWLDEGELDRLRTALLRAGGVGEPGDAPVLRKTHEIYRSGSVDAEPFPVDATRAAIVVVRDPRDVACSYAPFFGVSLDEAIEAMAGERGNGRPSAAHGRTAQPWGSWSSHYRSWLGGEVPFPVHRVRYEDLRVDAVATLAPVFDAIGLPCRPGQLEAAVEMARFERLAAAESARGFRETSPRTERFFRSGRAGGWREELTLEQVAAIEAAHGDVMAAAGYECETCSVSR